MISPEALIAAVGGLTAQRDREVIDRQAVGLLEALVLPRSVAIYRCIDHPGGTRLLLRAARSRGQVPWYGDTRVAGIEGLPALDARPVHALAFAAGQAQINVEQAPTQAGPGWLSVCPRRIDADRYGLVEILSDAPLDDRMQALVEGVLHIYGNQLELLDYSERDALTGLANRKTFDESFLRLTGPGREPDDVLQPGGPEQRSAADASTYWLAVLDIDHFKSINDRFGHLIGDEVLLLVAGLLRKGFRYGDRFYRFGGEEFVVVLRAPERAGAAAAFERFRRAMESFPFPQAGRVTVSIGFTAVQPGDSASAAIARADEAVYYGKAQGRNRVGCHEELVATGAIAGASNKIGDVELF
jgi:diguanylate cyclase (GGDEF)-like protein